MGGLLSGYSCTKFGFYLPQPLMDPTPCESVGSDGSEEALYVPFGDDEGEMEGVCKGKTGRWGG